MATISELTAFKLADAIKFHKKLNPKLWKDNKLKPDVREQLLIIAKDFIEYLGVKDLDIADIAISGSNAAFTWTPHSDLDLHIVVNFSERMREDEIYQELFRAKKTLYNDLHSIKIRRIPIELYVQDAALPVVSLGQYSVLNDKWIKLPKKETANLDQTATKAKFDQLTDLAELALQTKDEDRLSRVIDIINRYRRAGLAMGGEFSPENLAWKCLRTKKIIKKLYKLSDKLHSENLSMFEDDDQILSEQNFTSKQQVINHFVKHRKYGVTASQATARASAAWNRGWRGSVQPTQKSPSIIPPNYRLPYKDDDDDDVLSEMNEEWESFKNVNEASGYIPSEKQKNDPRFKSALTVDIHPGSIKQNASKLGSKISRAGIPPLANPNGKIPGVFIGKLTKKFKSLDEELHYLLNIRNNFLLKLNLIEEFATRGILTEATTQQHSEIASGVIKTLGSFSADNLVVGREYIPIEFIIFHDNIIPHDVHGNAPATSGAKFGRLIELTDYIATITVDNINYQYPRYPISKTVTTLVTFFIEDVDNYGKFCMTAELVFDIKLPKFG